MEQNQQGQKIAEGKTKIIYQVADNPHHVIMVSKNSISAGNGLKRDELPGKASCSNRTTCNVYRLLQLSSIPTHFVRQESAESFRALKCSMIPLEVIVRRLAAGSYLKRFPELKQGHRFETPVVEFTFKDDALGDPLISDEEILQKKLVCGPVTVDTKIIEQLKSLALKTFLALEKGWALLDVTLVDFKVEFGVTSDGQVILADVIDNDSWRIWPKGDPSQMKDKQVYRDLPLGKLQDNDVNNIMKNYEWVASETTRLIDSIIEPIGNGPLVGIIMGSQSDWETMKNATTILDQLNIPYEARIVSAHRTPERLFAYAKTAKSRGLKVIIAGAGGAAHLPGMVSSLTVLPVLGVPVQSRTLSGMDSLLSIVQMPGGIPVGTLAIGNAGATNAGLLAASILASSGNYPDIEISLEKYREKQTASVAEIPVDTLELSKQTTSSVAPAVPVPQQILQTVSHNNNLIPNFPLKQIPPGATIGIVGGGQLAKMIAVAAAQLGYKSHIYCPEKDSPAFYVSDDYTMASYTDERSLSMFAAKVSVVTYEFENVPKQTVDALSRWTPVRPNGNVLAICQNRLKEKRFVNSVGVPTTKFESVESAEELKKAIEIIGYPAIIKSNTMGYDGKGQIFIRQGDDLDAVWNKMLALKSPTAILEAFVDFQMEVSVIVCRGFDGQTTTFPVVENRHENHILKTTIVPAEVSDSVKKQAIDSAIKIANGIELTGILAVEMFVTKENTIVVNELAPRPHNSGHWSIEGCATSQFEQHVRTICGLPMGSTKVLSKRVVMNNLLGDEIHEWMKYLQTDNAHLHVYGKAEARPGRKMGHVTFLFDE